VTRDTVKTFTKILSPFAPHLAEELWNMQGNKNTIAYEPWPEVNEEYLKEDTFEYPVSVNGKLRFKIELPVSMDKEEIGRIILKDERAQKWLATGTLANLIVVPNRIVNLVIRN